MVPEPVVALGVCLKVGLVLAVAGGVVGRMGRATAAVRHRVWTLAMGIALALVALSPVAPRVPVPVPIRMAAEPSSITGDRGTPRAQPVAGAQTEAARPTGPAGLTVQSLRLGLETLSTLWLLGALAVGSWLLAGHAALAWLWFRARRSPLRLAFHDPLRGRLRTTHARVRWSPEASVPITWGTLRPVILIPTSARSWPAARLRSVLLHELAHVTRRDALAQALASVVCTLFWFNPLAWHAFRRLRAESEHACDDCVLRSGVGATAYARHLLAVARAARRPHAFPAAAAMTEQRDGDLEHRVRAILDVRSARAPCGRNAGLALGLASLMILWSLAGLRTQIEPRFDHPATTRAIQHR